MRRIKKYLSISLSLLFVGSVCGFAQPNRSPMTSPVTSPIASPIMSPINSPIGSPSATDTDAYGSYDRRRLNRDSYGAQDPRGFVPYNSLESIGRQGGLNRLRSLLQRSTSSYSYSQRSAALQNPNITGLGQPQLLPGQLLDNTSSLELNNRRPMSMELTDIDIALGLDMKLLELKNQYGDTPLEMGVLNEPVRKSSPDITELLQQEGPAVPQTPQLPADPFNQQQQLDDIKDGDLYDSLLDAMEQRQPEEPIEEVAPENKYGLKIPKREPLPEADHKKAAEIRGKHKTFESLAKANTEDYIKIANKMLTAEKFYKAADACTLALVWMPKNAEAHLIKGLSLFGAGEYMSASFFIQQAIKLNKDYASEKIGLEEKLPDIDLIDNRLVEAKQWQRQARSPEIAFLVAFIYYQQGNVISASEMIQKTTEKMSDNPAAKALQEVIEKADRY